MFKTFQCSELVFTQFPWHFLETSAFSGDSWWNSDTSGLGTQDVKWHSQMSNLFQLTWSHNIFHNISYHSASLVIVSLPVSAVTISTSLLWGSLPPSFFIVFNLFPFFKWTCAPESATFRSLQPPAGIQKINIINISCKCICQNKDTRGCWDKKRALLGVGTAILASSA